mgnify:FL=1
MGQKQLALSTATGGGPSGGPVTPGGGAVTSIAPGTPGDVRGGGPMTGPGGASPITQAIRVADLVRRAAGLIPEGAPGSFEMSPETRAAFEAQRAGERADLTGGGREAAAGFPVAGPALIGEIGAGGAPPSDVFNPNIIGGGGGAEGAGGAASWAGALPLLEIGPRQAIQLGIAGGVPKDPTHSWQARYPSGYEAGLLPFAGAVLGPLVNLLGRTGMFGQHRSRSAALKAEAVEAGRIGDTLRGPIGAYDQAANLEDFFNVGGHVGYLDRPAEFLQRALMDPDSIMAASSPGGSWSDESAMGVRTGLLGPSIQATVQSAVNNARRLAEQPDALDQLARAEHQAQRRGIEQQYSLATQNPELWSEHVNLRNTVLYEDPAARADLDRRVAEAQARVAPQVAAEQAALDQRFQADPFSVLPPDFLAFWGAIRPTGPGTEATGVAPFGAPAPPAAPSGPLQHLAQPVMGPAGALGFSRDVLQGA